MHKGTLWVMAYRLPPLSAVRVFESAARHGNFTKAAQELGMTQAAVSYQIKLLEERVGTPLFLRRPRQVLLTAAGQRLAPATTHALETLDAAFAGVKADSADVLAVNVVTTLPPTGWCSGSATFRSRIRVSPCACRSRRNSSTSAARKSMSPSAPEPATGRA